MTTHEIVVLSLKGSLALMVLGVGMQSTMRDATSLVRRPALLARSFLAMSVLMPLLAVSLAKTFALTPVVSLALVALTLAPVPPFLPMKVTRAGGDSSYIVGLLVTASLAAIVVIPLSVSLLGLVFDEPLRVRPAMILRLVGTSVLVPLVIGIALRALAPTVGRFAKPVTIASIVVLVAAMIPLLMAAWPAMRSLIGNGTLAAIVGMTLAGLAVGHLLGGPQREDRTVLAFATATRHPAVAIAILTANFPNEKHMGAAVLLALIVGAIASMPYKAWSKRRSEQHRRAVPLPAQH
jgi:bile acid:Na+ symporter, BASS family